VDVAVVAPAPDVALLDGRYQLIRQLSGPPRAPLMVASDLQTGRVVCIRLQRFSTATASLAAVPLLTRDRPVAGDGPLLPYDFGVDDGTAYLVRDYVTATSLEQLLAEPESPPPLEIVSLLRRAGQALITAAEQGFRHPGLALRHLLVTPDGRVRVSGYDGGQPGQRRNGVQDGAMLAALLRMAFADTPMADLPPALRALLTRSKSWQATAPPDLDAVVRHLRHCEEQLAGYSRVGEGVARTAHVAAAVFGRFRRLGPLLHPYLVVLALVAAIVVFAAHALASPANPGRIVVYPVPTHAATDPAAMYPFANPPTVLVTATTAETSTATATSVAATRADVPAALPVRTAEEATTITRRDTVRPAEDVATAPPIRRDVPPPSTHREAVAAPVRRAEVRQSTAAATTSRSATRQAASSDARSTVIVTSLTAQSTTARVTVIGAASGATSSSAPTAARSTTSVATSAATRASEQTHSSATTTVLSKDSLAAGKISGSRAVTVGR
jgi:hypothetical protein